MEELRAPSLTKLTGFLKNECMKIVLSYKYLRDYQHKQTFWISSRLDLQINFDLKVFELIDGWEKRKIKWQSQSIIIDILYTNIPIGVL